MPADGPTLLGMPDIELLSIIRVMCETIGNKTISKMFDSQSKNVAHSQYCKQTRTCRPRQIKVTQAKTKQSHQIILILAKSKLICQIILIPVTTKKQTTEHMRQSQVKYTINLMTFSLVYVHIFAGKRGQQLIPSTTEKSGLCIIKAIKRRTRMATEAGNHCPVGY